MKKKIVALFLTVVMLVLTMSASVLPVTATETTSTSYDDLYVWDADNDGENDLYFLWDGFSLKNGDALDGTMKNRAGTQNITYDTSLAKAENGGILYYGELNFPDLLPRHKMTVESTEYVVFDDVMMEMSLALNPHIQLAPKANGNHLLPDGRTPVTTGYWRLGILDWSLNAKNMAGVETARVDDSFGYISSTYQGLRHIERNNVELYTDTRANNRYIGNTIGVPYSLGLSIDYTMDDTGIAGQAALRFYRNAQDAKPAVWTYNGVAFTNDLGAEAVYAAKTADDLAGLGYDLASFGHGNGMLFYSLRFYTVKLTTAQQQQNHFVDLLAYHGVAVTDDFRNVSESVKKDVYEQFKDETYLSVTAEQLAAVVGSAIALEYNADELVTFDGYQVRVNAYPGLRTRYSIHDDALLPGATLKEVGTIVSPAEGVELNDLIVTQEEDGYTAPEGMQKAVVYNGAEWTNVFQIRSNQHFACSVVYKQQNEQTADAYQTEVIFRAYVIIEVGGADYVYYTDMTGTLFPDGKVSLYELSTLDTFVDYETSRQVIQTVEGAE